MEPSSAPDSEGMTDGRRVWGRLHLLFNLVLAAVVFYWVVSRWPASKQLFIYPNWTRLLAIAAFANLGYVFSRVFDIQMQLSDHRALWLRGRIVVWIVGTLMVAGFVYLWIANEVLD